MKKIEWKDCAWEKCGKKFLITHGNQKYCSDECYLANKRGRDREYQKRRSERISSIDDKNDRRETHDLAPVQTALGIYLEAALKDELGQLMEKRLSPYFHSLENRLERLEVGQEELGRVFPLTPSLSKKYPWRERAIRKVMVLIQSFGHLPKWQLRQFLEDAFQTDGRTAIEIMKKAEERLRRMKRDRGQMDLGEWS